MHLQVALFFYEEISRQIIHTFVYVFFSQLSGLVDCRSIHIIMSRRGHL